MHKLALFAFAVTSVMPFPASAALDSEADNFDINIVAVSSNGTGDSIGSIHIENHEDGVLFKPSLEGLEPGLHGFHLHEKASCEPAAKNGKQSAAAAAGGHLNPEDGEHRGPFDKGHAGDLPALYANEDGKVSIPVLAPKLDFNDLLNHALIIHAGGDNYSDKPEPLGGGGARVACGVVKDD